MAKAAWLTVNPASGNGNATVQNTVYQSAQSNKMMGGEGMNEIVDGEEGNDSPKTAEEAIQAMMVEKSMENPILGKALQFIDSQLGIRK